MARHDVEVDGAWGHAILCDVTTAVPAWTATKFLAVTPRDNIKVSGAAFRMPAGETRIWPQRGAVCDGAERNTSSFSPITMQTFFPFCWLPIEAL